MNTDLKKRIDEYRQRRDFGGSCDAACEIVPNTYYRAICAGAKFYCGTHDIHFDENREEIAPDKIFYTKHATEGCRHNENV